MRILSSFRGVWMVLFVVSHISCFPWPVNDDAKMGNMLDDGTADEDFLSVGDLFLKTGLIPEISVDLQPPEREFKVIIQDIPVVTTNKSSKKTSQPQKPIELPSSLVEPPTRRFGISLEKMVLSEPSSVALPLPKQQESLNVKGFLKDDDEGVISTSRTTFLGWNPELHIPGNNPEPRLSAPEVKIPFRSIPVKNQKLSGTVKSPTKNSWKNKKIQKPSQYLEPPTNDFAMKPKEVQRVLTVPIPLPPPRHLLPPTHEFVTLLTQEMLPPTREFMPLTRELTLPVHEFAKLPVKRLPPRREFLPLVSELTPPVHEFAVFHSPNLMAGTRQRVPLTRTLTPPDREFPVPPKPELQQIFSI